jgi:hypothetical protein
MGDGNISGGVVEDKGAGERNRLRKTRRYRRRKPNTNVKLVRDSLHELAKQTGMPPPDDGIVTQVLDVGHGARGDQIHAVLVALWGRNKFRSMFSWGFVPALWGNGSGPRDVCHADRQARYRLFTGGARSRCRPFPQRLPDHCAGKFIGRVTG